MKEGRGRGTEAADLRKLTWDVVFITSREQGRKASEGLTPIKLP